MKEAEPASEMLCVLLIKNEKTLDNTIKYSPVYDAFQQIKRGTKRMERIPC
jgi:hypothetical protein